VISRRRGKSSSPSPSGVQGARGVDPPYTPIKVIIWPSNLYVLDPLYTRYTPYNYIDRFINIHVCIFCTYRSMPNSSGMSSCCSRLATSRLPVMLATTQWGRRIGERSNWLAPEPVHVVQCWARPWDLYQMLAEDRPPLNTK